MDILNMARQARIVSEHDCPKSDDDGDDASILNHPLLQQQSLC
jgi:hypothetical protein